MAKSLAGVLAVWIVALLFGGCGGSTKTVETTTTTASKETVCVEILKKIQVSTEKAGNALKAEFAATTKSERQKQQDLKDLYMLEAQELNREFEAERCSPTLLVPPS
jgi:hypothetical protein